jgi:hypothetical protein
MSQADDTPPARPPSYFSGGWFRMGSDEPQFRITGRFQFEFLNPDGEDDPALASAHYASDLVATIARNPIWLAENWQVTPGALSVDAGVHSVAFVARNKVRTVEGRVSLSSDPSLWIKVEVHLQGERVFLAYMDRVWEEFELWPSKAAPLRSDEPVGHIGKRTTWLSLKVTAWPQLARVTGEEWFAIALPES